MFSNLKLSAMILIFTLAAPMTSPKALGAPKGGKVWTDPKAAAEQDPDFVVQGEYLGEVESDGKSITIGLQVIALGDGRFFAVPFAGGLPGQKVKSDKLIKGNVSIGQRKDGAVVFDDQESDSQMKITNGKITFIHKGKETGTARKIERKSPTLGAKPPKGAVVLFDGGKDSLANWNGGKMSEDGFLQEGTSTKRKFGSFKLHLEFRMPYKPNTLPSSQDRGNSGIYTFNRYETQLLDSFGLHYAKGDKSAWRKEFNADFGTNPKSDRTQWCACFYKFKMPDVNMCYPPLMWQTYDIEFTAPKFKDGKKIANARFTILHNGVKVHDNVELPKGTGAGGGRKEVAEESIYIQGHGNPVRFANIWIVPKD